MERKYVSDIIGEEYKQWKPGDRILISTATGSGKTLFILCVLLRFAAAMEKHIVYYCNRKFLNLQIQAAARRLLLNELGEDEEGLAAHLHIRTYQHTEHVRDYPHVKAVDENGKVLEGEWEVREEDVLFYVYDEAFYFVQDASFNVDTHYWYDTAKITERKKSISVFLAATPEPLLLYLKFMLPGRPNMEDLCRRYIARHYINERVYEERWVRYLRPRYLKLETERKDWASSSLPCAYENCRILQNALDELFDEVKAECRYPYCDFFEIVEQAYHSADGLFTYRYDDGRSVSDRYDYLDVQYFDDMRMLAGKIAESVCGNYSSEAKADKKNRWLVFVRRKEDAESLSASLDVLGCDSTMITAEFTKRYDGRMRKRRSTRNKAFDTLIYEEKLDCDVLISTSVLDCGISLRASNVSNLVICQPGKTSFLQMLGRIRIQEGERVKLYIQSFTPSQIKRYIQEAVNMFFYLTKLSQLNERVHKSEFADVPELGQYGIEGLFAKGMIPFLPIVHQNQLLTQMDGDKNRKNYTYRRQSSDRDSDLRVNRLAILYWLAQVYFAKEALPHYDKDPYYFLKEQLSWIGKTYEPTCWIDHDDLYSRLYTYVEEKSRDKKPMDKAAQMKFREECFLKIAALRNPPDKFRRIKGRFSVETGKYPGMVVLNELFCACNIPYKIIHNQNKKQIVDEETGERKVDNKTYWMIKCTDLEEERKKQEERNEELQRRKNEQQTRKNTGDAVECSKEKKNQLRVVVRCGTVG